jgi:hypothetical protein
MSFDYDPKDAENLMPDGEWEATVKAVIDTNDQGQPLRSKAGNAMIKVAFEVYVGDKKFTHYEYFVNSPAALWRYKVLAKSLGQSDAFKAGKFKINNHIGDALMLDIGTESDSTYGDKNVVKGMKAKAAGGTAKPSITAALPAINDATCPF